MLITVEYRDDQARARGFLAAVHELRSERLRDGAFHWAVYGDVADPARYVETFLVESWTEHLRQHERVTVCDREVQSRVNTFHTGKGPPVVSHPLARPGEGARGGPGRS